MIRKGILARAVQAIREKQTRGQPLKPGDLRVLEQFEASLAPEAAAAPAPVDPKEPPDLAFKDYKHGAKILGVHENSIGNWKRELGVEPLGEAPFSMKAYCLLLRRCGRLGSCKPSPEMHAIWLWAWRHGSEDAVNPDDPTHHAPANWKEEKERQDALRALEERQKARKENQTLDWTLLPTELVIERMRTLAHDLKSRLPELLAATNQIEGLTPTQRADLSDKLQAIITKIQADHATAVLRAIRIDK